MTKEQCYILLKLLNAFDPLNPTAPVSQSPAAGARDTAGQDILSEPEKLYPVDRIESDEEV